MNQRPAIVSKTNRRFAPRRAITWRRSARGDAQALGEFWVADGDVVDESGHALPGREVVAGGGKGSIKPNVEDGARPQAKIVGSKLRFLTDDVAIEDGTSEMAVEKGAAPVRGRFTAMWVKQGGKWKLASLREGRLEAPEPATLADLDWMVGDWSGERNGSTVEVSAHWNTNHTFLLRDLKLVNGGQVLFNAAQRIGWDPITGSIHSWVFDSDGGYGDGQWTKEGDSWVVEAQGVLPDGRRTTSFNMFTPDGKDQFIWKSLRSRTDGETQGDLEVKLTRKPSAN